jgi:hypothetical protein
MSAAGAHDGRQTSVTAMAQRGTLAGRLPRNPQLTHLSPTEAAAAVDQIDQRLLWTGAAANGALLLSYVGFAGGADDAAAALRFLTLPILLGLAGFSFGATAITWGVARVAVRQLESLATFRLKLASAQLAAFKDVLTAPSLDASVAKVIWGDAADDQTRQLLLGRLQVAKEQTDQAQPAAEAALADMKTHSDEGLKLIVRGRRWLSWSFVSAALSVSVLAGTAWLDKGKTATLGPATPSPAAQALPPCAEGSTECPPWERAWKEPPAKGTVVPAEDR